MYVCMYVQDIIYIYIYMYTYIHAHMHILKTSGPSNWRSASPLVQSWNSWSCGATGCILGPGFGVLGFWV